MRRGLLASGSLVAAAIALGGCADLRYADGFGSLGSPCTDGSECATDLCLLLLGRGPGVCTNYCDDGSGCVPGWTCGLTSSGRMSCRCGGLGPETCNAADDDCDGQVDEEEGTPLCPAGEYCSGSGCTCPPDRACGFECCGDDEVCSGGACTCTGELRRCADGCVDTETDRQNCGSCGNVCPAGQSCSAGRCECLDCDGTGACTDVSSSSLHCGACNRACVSGQACVEGVCQSGCEDPRLECNAECVDPRTDRRHCGSCSRRCPGACVDGTCHCDQLVGPVRAGLLPRCAASLFDCFMGCGDSNACRDECVLSDPTPPQDGMDCRTCITTQRLGCYVGTACEDAAAELSCCLEPCEPYLNSCPSCGEAEAALASCLEANDLTRCNPNTCVATP